LCYRTFDEHNKMKDRVPIAQDVIVELSPQNGEVTATWGGGLFYMPQGFTIDNHGNFWFTDIALHQVRTLYVTELYLNV
jgi:streptogramin lyase